MFLLNQYAWLLCTSCCHSKLHSGSSPPPPNLHHLEQCTSRAAAPKAIPSVLLRLFPSHMAPSFPRSHPAGELAQDTSRNRWSSWQYPLFSSPIAESLCLYQTLHFFVKRIFFLRNFQCVSTAWFPSDSSTILNNWAQVRETVQTSTHLSHRGGPLPSLRPSHSPVSSWQVYSSLSHTRSPKWTTDNNQRLL